MHTIFIMYINKTLLKYYFLNRCGRRGLADSLSNVIISLYLPAAPKSFTFGLVLAFLPFWSSFLNYYFEFDYI